MKVIKVCYKDIVLGKLTFQEGVYCYEASKIGVDKAYKKGYTTFVYDCDQSFVSDTLPASLQDLVSEEIVSNIATLTEILETDTEFDVLYKFAALDVGKPDFHVEI